MREMLPIVKSDSQLYICLAPGSALAASLGFVPVVALLPLGVFEDFARLPSVKSRGENIASDMSGKLFRMRYDQGSFRLSE